MPNGKQEDVSPKDRSPINVYPLYDLDRIRRRTHIPHHGCQMTKMHKQYRPYNAESALTDAEAVDLKAHIDALQAKILSLQAQLLDAKERYDSGIPDWQDPMIGW